MMEQIVYGAVLIGFLVAPCVPLARRWRQWKGMERNHRIALLLLSSSYFLVFILNALTSDYSLVRSVMIVGNLAILALASIFFALQRRHWSGFLVASLSVWGSWAMQLIANAAVA